MILATGLTIDSIFLISLLFVHPNQTNMFVVKMLSLTARKKLIVTSMQTMYEFSIRKNNNIFLPSMITLSEF